MSMDVFLLQREARFLVTMPSPWKHTLQWNRSCRNRHVVMHYLGEMGKSLFVQGLPFQGIHVLSSFAMNSDRRASARSWSKGVPRSSSRASSCFCRRCICRVPVAVVRLYLASQDLQFRVTVVSIKCPHILLVILQNFDCVTVAARNFPILPWRYSCHR